MVHCMMIPRATDTQSEYVMLIDFTQEQWLHERASMSVMRTLTSLFPLFTAQFTNKYRYNRDPCLWVTTHVSRRVPACSYIWVFFFVDGLRKRTKDSISLVSVTDVSWMPYLSNIR
jgi:hypothetical protein